MLHFTLAVVGTTSTLETQVTGLEEDVISLDERVGDLESGGGNNNLTGTEKLWVSPWHLSRYDKIGLFLFTERICSK